jgi:hypothetical protein
MIFLLLANSISLRMVPGIALDHTGIMSPTMLRRSKEMQAWLQSVSLLGGGPVKLFLSTSQMVKEFMLSPPTVWKS